MHAVAAQSDTAGMGFIEAIEPLAVPVAAGCVAGLMVGTWWSGAIVGLSIAVVTYVWRNRIRPGRVPRKYRLRR
jgi:hypothetical protein